MSGEARVLGKIADATEHRSILNRLAKEPYLPAIGMSNRQGNFHQRRFAGAVGSKQTKNRAGGYGQADAFESANLVSRPPMAERFGQGMCLEGGRHSRIIRAFLKTLRRQSRILLKGHTDNGLSTSNIPLLAEEGWPRDQ